MPVFVQMPSSFGLQRMESLRLGRQGLPGVYFGRFGVMCPPVNALHHAGGPFYDGRAAARYILCIRKEVLAMFAIRQTPPGVAL
jgi:hypothetical protein